jgi:hypothetical protein
MGEMQADLQMWIYVILGIIYLISRLRKKPQEQTDFPEYGPEDPVPGTGKAQPGRVEPVNPKEISFEDLLREITEGKTRSVPSTPEVSKPLYESYEDVLAEEEQDLEVVTEEKYTSGKVSASYEEAKRQAFARPSLEETMSLSDTNMTFGRFKEFENDANKGLLSHYLSDLRDPDGLKKAFVMSEVLKRKF